MFILKYLRTKIGKEMGTVFLILLIPMVVLNAGVSAQGAANVRETLVQNYKNILQMSSEQLSDRLQDLCQLTYSLTLDSQLNSLSIAEDDLRNLPEYVRFYSRLGTYTAQRLLQSDISVLLPKPGWVISTDSYIERLQNLPDFSENLSTLPQSLKWGIRCKWADQTRRCLSIVTGYLSQTQSNPLFFIELDEASVLEAIAPLSDSSGIEEMFLIDRSGEIFLSPDASIEKDRFIQSTRSAFESFFAQEERTGQCAYRSSGADYTVLLQKLSGTDCALGMLLNTSSLSGVNRVLALWTLTGLAVFFVLVMIYMIISYRHVVAPIDGIHETIERIGHGDFTADSQEVVHNEIGDIAVSLNRTVEKLRTLVDEKYVYEIQLAQTQLRFLRAQINPHFLYNSLFTLYTFIRNEDLDSAADLAIYLGQYYQINTRSDGGEAPLYQELEHVRLLVKIQNMRFGERLRYEEEVDESLKLLPIPNLTLLTMAENFLTHGVKDTQGELMLKISAAREDGWIVLTVTDNGQGVSEERLGEIRAQLENVDLQQSNLRGLQNILVRFRMAYGKKTSLFIFANEPHGLINQIRIPDEGSTQNV